MAESFRCNSRRKLGAPRFGGKRLARCPDAVLALVAGGEVDFVSVAKAALADPDWPRKVAAGQPPIPFDPAIFSPHATYAVEAAWRAGLPEG